MSEKIYLGQWEAGTTGCKPSRSPMEQNIRLTCIDGSPIDDPICYKRLIGCLLYLSNTRPGIAFSVKNVSHFNDSPSECNLSCSKIPQIHSKVRLILSMSLDFTT